MGQPLGFRGIADDIDMSLRALRITRQEIFSELLRAADPSPLRKALKEAVSR